MFSPQAYAMKYVKKANFWKLISVRLVLLGSFCKVKGFKQWVLTSLIEARHYSARAFRFDFFVDAARLKDIKIPDEKFFLGT